MSYPPPYTRGVKNEQIQSIVPRKRRSESFLHRLTPDQQDTLYDWLLTHSYLQVQQLAARPAPEGFGFIINLTSLRRFYRERAAQIGAEDLQEASESASEMPETALYSATERAMAQ